MKRIVYALLCAVFLLTGCKKANPSAEEVSVQTEKILVTLGDSISAGFGLPSPETERYSALLTGQLTAADQIEWKDINYAVSGSDTTDLIAQLDAGTAENLSDADTVALYIGANNLLHAYSAYFSKIFGKNEYPAEQGISFAKVAQIIKRIANSVTEIGTLEKEVDAGITKLKADLGTIYAKIRAKNPDAPIYMLNIYNPYAKVTLRTPLNLKEPFGEYAQHMIDRCNLIIAEFAGQHPDITLIDISGVFAACESVPVQGNINLGISTERTPNVDPHPTAEGQKLIADAVFAAMRTS